MHKQKQLHKKTRFWQRKKLMWPLGIITIAIISIIIFGGGGDEISYDTYIAERGDLIQEVSVTGRVEPSESVDLSFESSGRISEIYVDIGDKVIVGQELLKLNNADIQAMLNQAYAGASGAQAQLQQYEAAVRNQESLLADMQKGTRPEELQIAETSVASAEKALSDAEKNLENVKAKADADLENSYNLALTALPNAVSKAKISLLALSDIQQAHFNGNEYYDNQIKNVKADAAYALLGVTNAGRWATEFLSRESGGTFGLVQDLSLSHTNEQIDDALVQTLAALQKVKIALDSIPITTDLSTTEELSLDTEKLNMNTEITSISSAQQSILVVEAANQSLITTAETGVNNAENLLLSAQNTLTLKQAGYTQDQIDAQSAVVDQYKANLAAQKAVVNQAYASVDQYKAQIEKTILRAPLDGIITKMEAQVGEIVFPSSSTYEVQIPLVSIIGEGNFEMEANIAEVDIAKIKLGNTATVTLDAYADTEFTATVTFVDPAETYVDSIPTYRVKLQFDEQDERIKSGMTANIDIVTGISEDTIIIPQRAVLNKDGMKIVRIAEEYDEENITQIKQVEVKIGLNSNDGKIEILEGIEEGDKVVTQIND